MSKLLKVIFVILVLVTIGEVGYYFYILKGNTLGINIPWQKTGVSPIPIESGTTSNPIPSYPQRKELSLSEVFDFFSQYKLNKGQDVFIVVENKGRLGKVEMINEGKRLAIEILSDDGQILNSFAHKIEDAQYLFYKQSDNTRTALQISELKVGDQVTEIHKINAFDPKTRTVEYLIRQ